MVNKMSNNFSEFLQHTSFDYFSKEKDEILSLIKDELDGILKQISMLIKSYNSTVELKKIEKKFNSILDGTNPYIDNLIRSKYNLCYQELFSKIIRDGDFALKSNRYEASSERLSVLESTLANYKCNIDKSKEAITNKIEEKNSNFVKDFIINNILACLEDTFYDIPCKQNDDAYNEIEKYLNKTTDIIIGGLQDICVSSMDDMNNDVLSYLENKIKFEKGYTNNLTLSQLLQAKEAFIGSNTKRPQKKGNKKNIAA